MDGASPALRREGEFVIHCILGFPIGSPESQLVQFTSRSGLIQEPIEDKWGLPVELRGNMIFFQP